VSAELAEGWSGLSVTLTVPLLAAAATPAIDPIKTISPKRKRFMGLSMPSLTQKPTHRDQELTHPTKYLR